MNIDSESARVGDDLGTEYRTVLLPRSLTGFCTRPALINCAEKLYYW